MPENRFYENIRIVRTGANMNRAGDVFSRSFTKKEQSIASVFSMKPFQKLWKYTERGDDDSENIPGGVDKMGRMG